MFNWHETIIDSKQYQPRLKRNGGSRRVQVGSSSRRTF
jgi:hypothetical protein